MTVATLQGNINRISLALTERHFLESMPATQMKRIMQRRYIVCCEKRLDGKRIRKELRY